MKKIDDEDLWDAIAITLEELEDKGEIVICSQSSRIATRKIYDTVRNVVPHTSLSAAELGGLKMLTYHAINDKKFFDSEMPTLTGYNADGFKKIVEKLPIM